MSYIYSAQLSAQVVVHFKPRALWIVAGYGRELFTTQPKAVYIHNKPQEWEEGFKQNKNIQIQTIQRKTLCVNFQRNIWEEKTSFYHNHNYRMKVSTSLAVL